MFGVVKYLICWEKKEIELLKILTIFLKTCAIEMLLMISPFVTYCL